MQRLVLASILTVLTLLPASFAVAQNIQNAPIKRFYEVSSGVYRGARPTTEGLRFLAEIGVKTVLYLDNDSDHLKWETEEALKLGIKVIATPMSGFWKPRSKQVNQSLSILADRNNHPIFIHCKHGRDRTGLIVALLRVEFQGWKPAQAYQEMLDRGFRQALFLLDYFYQKRTGWSPPSQNSDPVYN